MRTRRSLLRLAMPFIVIICAAVIALVMFIIQVVHATGETYYAAMESDVRRRAAAMEEASSRADEILQNCIADNPAMIGMTWSNDKSSYNLHKYRVWASFGGTTYHLPVVDAYFFYSIGQEDYFEAVHNSMDYNWRKKVARAVEKTIADMTSSETLRWVDVDGQKCIVHAIATKNLITGYWVRAEHLLEQIASPSEGVRYVMLDKDGNEVCRAGMSGGNIRSKKIRSISVYDGLFTVVVTNDGYSVLNNITSRQMVWILLSVLLVALCIGWSLASYLRLIHPIYQLIRTMERIGNGDTTVRARIGRHADFEMCSLCNTFNMMMDQLEKLRIENYEQQLRLKTSEMERIKLQINPHFFINVLNSIRSYAMLHNTKAITDMTGYMADYYRSVLRKNVMVQPLYQELEHTLNYVRIQQLRFSGRLQYITDVDSAANRAYVPILMVHTFVDNAVRYVLMQEEGWIHVSAHMTEGNEVLLCIEDNGSGFDDNTLRRLNDKENLADANGNHVGIGNLMERISEFYAGRAAVSYANRPDGGARISIRFPKIESEAGNHV